MNYAWILSFALGAVGGVDLEPPRVQLDRAAYEDARARAGRDAEAQIDLALWCEQNGFAAERITHLTRAILLDPGNARARGLLGYLERDGRWIRPVDAAGAVEDSPDRQDLLREYLERRARTPDDADGQYKLALWCEENGLAPRMIAHLHRVVQLDPRREGAWRRLGYKKVGGRWVDPEAEAIARSEREAQDQADKLWRPRIEKIRNALASRDRAKRSEAEAALAAIDDPRAVPMIWKFFARGGDEGRQRLAIDVYSRIEAPSASAALALIAVYSPHAAIRSDAARLLQRRDPRDYASLLAGLIRDEIKYKVRPVEGPGSQGELIVEGKEARVRRRYSPLQVPALEATDELEKDEDGKLVAVRRTGRIYRGSPIGRIGADADGSVQLGGAGFPTVDSATISGNFLAVPTGVGQNPALSSALQSAGLSPAQAGQLQDRLPQATYIPAFGTMMAGSRIEPVYAEGVKIPIEQMVAESRASALVARRQLEDDVRQIEARNAPVREVNERAVAVLKNVSGRDLGDDREKWTAWAVDLEGYVMPQRSTSATPETYVEDVPIAFQPQATFLPSDRLIAVELRHSCFAAGTPIRTDQGLRAIESIRAGDLVLSQDTRTGELAYQPVVTVFHNPPNETFKIEAGRETIHPTGIHRLWKAGRGWVMARDVQVGDQLRTVGGLAEVIAVEKEPARPVFNLRLAGGDNYCVGEAGLIAHDNSHVEPVEKPFDRIPELASEARP